ncbi:MAG: hypothetical protein AAB368_08400, partial [bacterium]
MDPNVGPLEHAEVLGLLTLAAFPPGIAALRLARLPLGATTTFWLALPVGLAVCAAVWTAAGSSAPDLATPAALLALSSGLLPFLAFLIPFPGRPARREGAADRWAPAAVAAVALAVFLPPMTGAPLPRGLGARDTAYHAWLGAFAASSPGLFTPLRALLDPQGIPAGAAALAAVAGAFCGVPLGAALVALGSFGAVLICVSAYLLGRELSGSVLGGVAAAVFAFGQSRGAGAHPVS